MTGKAAIFIAPILEDVHRRKEFPTKGRTAPAVQWRKLKIAVIALGLLAVSKSPKEKSTKAKGAQR